ncbi:MAG: hypothetical protein RJQ10_13480 [Haliea sp.]|uniref:hypothetical protein n=1 Tax=Haliea sp. TaxID=1932666 RepID=UPI0032EBA46D
MGRGQHILELQIAEAELVSQRQLLQQRAARQIDHLRAQNPLWLIGSGFLAGVLVQQLDVLLGEVGTKSSLKIMAQFWPLLAARKTAVMASSCGTP